VGELSMSFKIGKITTLAITIFMIFPSLVTAQILFEQKKILIETKDFEIRDVITFSEKEFRFETFMGYDIIRHLDDGQLSEDGKPMLPQKTIMIALPEGMKATNVRILNVKEKEMPDTYKIIPTQLPQTLDKSMKELVSIQCDTQIYESNKPYPAKRVEITGQTDLAGQGLAILTIYPIQYIPSSKKLKLLTSLEFIIEGVNGNICGDYLSEQISEEGREIYQKMVEEMVINPEDVKLHTKENIQKSGVDPGDYDYVIITNTSWVNAFQSLSDWKTKKGVPANIVTTDWIYSNGNYSGSDKEKIRAFIQDAHVSWGATFFLLGGDTNHIPYHTAYYQGDSIPTDTYYSDYDDDWTCEVHIGRASVYQTGTGSGGIANFINKTLNYEKNPPTSNYTKNIALFGFDLDSITDGEDCKIDIDDLYIPSNWSVTTVYDSHSGNHEDAVDTVVNNGQNIINHIDHSNQYYMGTGSTNHDWGLDTSEVDAFNNGNKTSTWYSIGCWAAAYDYDNCIAEHFVRDTDGGGVAFVGNSRYGWYYQGYDDLLSSRYDRYFFRSFFDQNHYKLGDLFSDHKMDAYNSMDPDNYNKYIFTELTLFGDPEMPLWKENPSSFAVTHPDSISIGSSSFTVHVETSEGTNVNNAYVCLWKDDEIYLTNYTDSTGNVTFNPSPSTSGKVNVTVTKQDFLPYEGEVDVNQWPNEPSDPEPEDGATDIDINADLSWNCSDPDGDELTYNVYFDANDTTPNVLVSENQTGTTYDPGTMEYVTNYYWQIVAWDEHGLSTSGPVWNFTTVSEPNNPPNSPSDPNPADGEIDVSVDTILSWNCSDPDGDLLIYNVYLEKDDSTPDVLVSEDQSGKTYDPEGLEHGTVYYWKIVAKDNHSATTEGPVWSFTSEETIPDLNCDGSLSWTDVSIGSTVTGRFYVENIGDPTSLLDWEIESKPDWGTWIIAPEEGYDLTPEHEPYIVEVSIIAPDKENSEFTGEVKIVNMDDNSDFCVIDVSLATPKNKPFIYSFPILSWLIERFTNAFPILRDLLRL
jgi:hypothetical protein